MKELIELFYEKAILRNLFKSKESTYNGVLFAGLGLQLYWEKHSIAVN